FQRKCLLAGILMCMRLIGIHADAPTDTTPTEFDGLLCPSGMDVVRNVVERTQLFRHLLRRLSSAAQSKHSPLQSMAKRILNIGISSPRI
ncbi:hypothetical protein PENTCL1PPCAC_12684, partial [Pristionchus entomophagus]